MNYNFCKLKKPQKTWISFFWRDDADNCEFKLECDQRNCVSCGRSCKPVKSCKCTISDSKWQQLKADVTSVPTHYSPGEGQCFDWCICKYVPKGFFPWLSNPHKDKPDKCFRASNPRNNARVRRCMLKSGCDKKCDGNGYGAWECKCKCDQEDCKGCEFEDEKVAITELLWGYSILKFWFPFKIYVQKNVELIMKLLS